MRERHTIGGDERERDEKDALAMGEMDMDTGTCMEYMCALVAPRSRSVLVPHPQHAVCVPFLRRLSVSPDTDTRGSTPAC